jgi:hypothetical protein
VDGWRRDGEGEGRDAAGGEAPRTAPLGRAAGSPSLASSRARSSIRPPTPPSFVIRVIHPLRHVTVLVARGRARSRCAGWMTRHSPVPARVFARAPVRRARSARRESAPRFSTSVLSLARTETKCDKNKKRQQERSFPSARARGSVAARASERKPRAARIPILCMVCDDKSGERGRRGGHGVRTTKALG